MELTVKALRERFINLPTNHPAKVDTAFADSDGYWIYLKRGFGNTSDPGTHIIHEDTAREALRAFRSNVRPCTCRDCITGDGW